jgi:hypothetical protein
VPELPPHPTTAAASAASGNPKTLTVLLARARRKNPRRITILAESLFTPPSNRARHDGAPEKGCGM